ncbi:MAG: tetratricopeptide repeat protein [Treponema sp.]|nr:tetratricopeptide repeat protein [Treponema sp.]
MSDANLLLNRAKSALIAHDYTQAARIYKNLILDDPKNLDYKMQLGNLYVKAGKDDQALTIYNQVKRADTENLDALVAISGIYRRQKKYEESVAVLEQALVVCEDDPKSRAKISYNLGFTYRQMGNLDDAINCFEEVVEENPSDVLANNHLGAIYALKEKHTKAIEAYNRGLKYDPNHPILQFNIAKSYAEIGETQKALSFYEGALRAKPGWTDAIEAYADLLLGENKVGEADNAVTQALELYPEDVKMLTAKGNVFNRQSIFEEAEIEYKKALDVDDSYKNALTGLAHALEHQGKVDEAIEMIRKAENLNPDDTKIIKQSAHIHITANKLDDAYGKITKLQEINQNDVQTINLLGQYYIVGDDASRAEECFANIKKIDPNYNEVYRDWAERFLQIGDEEKAEPYLQTAVQKDPSDALSMVHLGELYERQNELGKALQFYTKASKADSFNAKSKRASARLLETEPELKNFLIDSPITPQLRAEPEDTIDDLISKVGEISLAENDANFKDDFDDVPRSLTGNSEEHAMNVDELNKESFDFDKFGMDNLADENAELNSVDSVADMLSESTENDMSLNSLAPKEEEMLENPEFEDIPVENPEQKPEMTDESLSSLEDQIKRVAELTEKLSFTAEKLEKVEDEKLKAETESKSDKNSEEAEEDFGEADLIPDDEIASPQEPTEEELIAEEEILEDDLLSEEENPESEEELLEEENTSLLNEEDLSDDSESEDFLEDVPDALQENEELESPTSAEEDLAMKRAVDMLPTISASIEDRSLLYKFREYLELFKTLRDMLDYLPPSQKKEFMMSKNRVMLDFIISKLSGKAGLFATSKALIRSGILHENENARGQDLEGVALAREVIDHLRELSGKLDDDYLRDALDTEALKLLEQF